MLMIIVYTRTSIKSCRQAISWMEEEKLLFKERKITKDNPMTEREVKEILSMTSNGFDDIISKNSKFYKEYDSNIENLTISQLITLLIDNPTSIRTPIITNGEKIQVGFNHLEIRSFIPRNVRVIQSRATSKYSFFQNCMDY